MSNNTDSEDVLRMENKTKWTLQLVSMGDIWKATHPVSLMRVVWWDESGTKREYIPRQSLVLDAQHRLVLHHLASPREMPRASGEIPEISIPGLSLVWQKDGSFTACNNVRFKRDPNLRYSLYCEYPSSRSSGGVLRLLHSQLPEWSRLCEQGVPDLLRTPSLAPPPPPPPSPPAAPISPRMEVSLRMTVSPQFTRTNKQTYASPLGPYPRPLTPLMNSEPTSIPQASPMVSSLFTPPDPSSLSSLLRLKSDWQSAGMKRDLSDRKQSPLYDLAFKHFRPSPLMSPAFAEPSMPESASARPALRPPSTKWIPDPTPRSLPVAFPRTEHSLSSVPQVPATRTYPRSSVNLSSPYDQLSSQESNSAWTPPLELPGEDLDEGLHHSSTSTWDRPRFRPPTQFGQRSPSSRTSFFHI